MKGLRAPADKPTATVHVDAVEVVVRAPGRHLRDKPVLLQILVGSVGIVVAARWRGWL